MAAGWHRRGFGLMAILLVAGCEQPPRWDWNPFAGESATGIQRVVDSVPLGPAAESGAAAAAQVARARRFVASLPDPARVRVSITGLEEGADRSLTDGLVNALVDGGIAREHIAVMALPGPVTLQIEYYVAAVPPCPDENAEDGGTRPSQADGCTVRQGLISTIADPADVVGYSSTGPAPAEAPTAAVARYRDNKIKDLLSTEIKVSSSSSSSN